MSSSRRSRFEDPMGRPLGSYANIVHGCLVHLSYCKYTVQYVCKHVSIVCSDQSVSGSC